MQLRTYNANLVFYQDDLILLHEDSSDSDGFGAFPDQEDESFWFRGPSNLYGLYKL
jgi:hypothetical protein